MSPRIRRREFQPVEGWPATMPPLLRRIYAARGIGDPALAQPRLAQLPPPDDLGGLVDAVRLLAEAIARDTRILVVGDFDCAI